MTTSRLLRPAVALSVLFLAGCVAPPPAPIPGQTVLGQACAAGFYQCVLPAAGPVGSPCACPGLGAPSYGSIRQ